MFLRAKQSGFNQPYYLLTSVSQQILVARITEVIYYLTVNCWNGLTTKLSLFFNGSPFTHCYWIVWSIDYVFYAHLSTFLNKLTEFSVNCLVVLRHQQRMTHSKWPFFQLKCSLWTISLWYVLNVVKKKVCDHIA